MFVTHEFYQASLTQPAAQPDSVDRPSDELVRDGRPAPIEYGDGD